MSAPRNKRFKDYVPGNKIFNNYAWGIRGVRIMPALGNKRFKNYACPPWGIRGVRIMPALGNKRFKNSAPRNKRFKNYYSNGE